MRILRFNNHPVYKPANSFTSLRSEIDRLFDAAFPALGPVQREADFPVDLYQEKNAFVLRAELPGFRKEDLNIEVAEGTLTVTAHQKSEIKVDEKEAKNGTAQREYRVSRSVTLPEHLKLNGIKATYENGVLTVTLPKAEETKPRQITISAD